MSPSGFNEVWFILVSLSLSLSRTVACVGHDGGECLHGEPDLARVMETERDPEKLLRVWARWRDAAGAGEK